MEQLLSYWPWLTFVIDVVLLLGVTLHVIMTKRDPRSAVAWIAIVWLVPIIGALVRYKIFGLLFYIVLLSCVISLNKIISKLNKSKYLHFLPRYGQKLLFK